MTKSHRAICNRATPIKKERGIYFLCKGGKVVYVGQSVNLINRISEHLSEGKKNFDGYYYEYVGKNDVMSDVEAEYIVSLNPKYNKVLPQNSIYVSVNTVAKKTKWKRDEIREEIKRAGLKPVYTEWYKISEIARMLDGMKE